MQVSIILGIISAVLIIRAYGELCTIQSIKEVDRSCPKYVFLDIGHSGMGDQLLHLFGGIALACAMKATLVVPDNFGVITTHNVPGGYAKAFRQLGIPLDFLKLSQVLSNGGMSRRTEEFSKLIHNQMNVPKSSDSCNSFTATKYECYKGWCAVMMNSIIYSLAKPVLDEMIAAQKHHRWHSDSPLKHNLVNIVWHIRILEPFRENDFPWYNTSYYKTIYDFIGKSLGDLPHQHIFIGENLEKWSHLFKEVPSDKYSLHSAKSLRRDIDMIRHADLVVTTGSSFPSSILWFCEYDRPIILESLAKELFDWAEGRGSTRVRDRYAMPEGRSIRLDVNGFPVPLHHPSDHMYDDIKEKLQDMGVLSRLTLPAPPTA